MRRFILLAFHLIISATTYSQFIKIETFISLLGKKISYIDSVFSNDYRAVLDDADEKHHVYIWKTGFNSDRSKHNEDIVYHTSDSTEEFFLTFPSHKADHSVKLYDSVYEEELNNGTYQRVDDTIETFMDSNAIVKNYQWQGYLVKKYKIAANNITAVRVIKHLVY
jgi:hypothetical protein